MPDTVNRIPQIVAVLGRGLLHRDQAVAVADDLGLTRGDGCFDATRVVVGPQGPYAENLQAHLDRLARSASRLELDCPDADTWRELVDLALSAWTGTGTAALKLVLTRGSEFGEPGVLAYVTLTGVEPGDAALEVVTLSRGHAADAFAHAPWLLGGVKTLAYAVNVAAQREAHQRGADDVLFVSTDGFALEGPTSGLIVATGGSLATTPVGATGILDSVTVRLVRAGALRAGIPFADRLITPAEIHAADAAWLASSVRGVRPIASLDGVRIGRDDALTGRIAHWAGFSAPGA